MNYTKLFNKIYLFLLLIIIILILSILYYIYNNTINENFTLNIEDENLQNFNGEDGLSGEDIDKIFFKDSEDNTILGIYETNKNIFDPLIIPLPRGPIGAMGAIGKEGPTGKPGKDGIDAPKPICSLNEQNIDYKGFDGPQGPKGDTGKIGEIGLTYDDGINGTDCTYNIYPNGDPAKAIIFRQKNITNDLSYDIINNDLLSENIGLDAQSPIYIDIPNKKNILNKDINIDEILVNNNFNIKSNNNIITNKINFNNLDINNNNIKSNFNNKNLIKISNDGILNIGNNIDSENNLNIDGNIYIDNLSDNLFSLLYAKGNDITKINPDAMIYIYDTIKEEFVITEDIDLIYNSDDFSWTFDGNFINLNNIASSKIPIILTNDYNGSFVAGILIYINKAMCANINLKANNKEKKSIDNIVLDRSYYLLIFGKKIELYEINITNEELEINIEKNLILFDYSLVINNEEYILSNSYIKIINLDKYIMYDGNYITLLEYDLIMHGTIDEKAITQAKLEEENLRKIEKEEKLKDEEKMKLEREKYAFDSLYNIKDGIDSIYYILANIAHSHSGD